MRVIDISNPSAPREIASYKTPGYAEEISVLDGAAYVANYDAGLMILGLEDNLVGKEPTSMPLRAAIGR